MGGMPAPKAEKELIWKRARIAAIMGNCAKTKESFKSGMAMHLLSSVELQHIVFVVFRCQKLDCFRTREVRS